MAPQKRGAALARSRPALWVLISVLVAAAVLLLGLGQALDLARLKAFDALFYLRAQVTTRKASAPIVLVGIDDQTFAQEPFRIPQTLWHNHFAAVIQGLAQAGAKVIGLDFLLPQALFDDLVPEYSRTWLRAFLSARRQGVPVVTGLIDTGERRIMPQSRYLQILGGQNFGLFNLTTDKDDFIRRQRLVFSGPEEKSPGLSSVTYLLARAFEPDLSLPAETIYIDYLTAQPPFAQESFARVYQAAVQGDLAFLKGRFAGRIVLIGETDSLSQDRHPTPLYYLSGRVQKRTPGVEILAHAVHTLLAGRFFAPTPPGWRFLLYLALALLAGLSAMFGSQRRLFLVTPLLILAYGGAALVGFIHYLILPLAGGLCAVVLGVGAPFSYRHWVVDKEKRKVRAMFQRYLPPKVVDRLLATRDADFFRGEERRLCVLFSDIRSFTKYSEKKTPAEVVSRLNEYFEAMSAAITAEGGVVDKYLGDGLMAFFGAFDEGQPSRAGARAAWRMLAELERLNRAWAARGEETFRIGVGLHTGVVKIGNIGSSNKMDYTVIGDAVNLASRLESKTKELGEAVVMSEDVSRDLAEEAEVEDRGVVEIRGRAAIRVYALKGLRGES